MKEKLTARVPAGPHTRARDNTHTMVDDDIGSATVRRKLFTTMSRAMASELALHDAELRVSQHAALVARAERDLDDCARASGTGLVLYAAARVAAAEDALADATRERDVALHLVRTYDVFFAGGCGVGVLPSALPGIHLRSIAARIDCTSAPDA